jgi:hypothetical protein
MTNPAVATLEAALRSRKLDHTLTSAQRPGAGDGCFASTRLEALDRCLNGGLPCGQLSEIVGARSSGRTTLLLQTLAAATRRGETAALVDTFDHFDVTSAVSAGVGLERLLWIRGHAISGCHGADPARRSGPFPSGSSALADRLIDRALKALMLVLQAGGFGLVAIDLAAAPPLALARLPYTTWLRVQRGVEGHATVCLAVASQPLARSAGGVTVALTGHTQWTGTAERSRRLAGLGMRARVLSPKRQMAGAAAAIGAVSASERVVSAAR